MKIESQYFKGETMDVKPNLVKFQKNHGGKLGETLFGGPTLYFENAVNMSGVRKIERALKRYPDLKMEWRCQYTTIAIS